MRKNNKGFMLVETLLVSVFVATTLIFLFVQFERVKSSYDKAFTYNTVSNVANAKTFSIYLFENGISDASEYVSNNSYLDITTCPATYLTNTDFCKYLINKLNIKKIYLTKVNNRRINNFQTSAKGLNLDNTFLNFIDNIKQVDSTYKDILIVEYNDKTFAYYNPHLIQELYVTPDECFITINNMIKSYDTTNPACKTDVVIPETIGGVVIDTISDNAFENKGITSVLLSKNLIEIGNNAFNSNIIEKIVIPEKVRNIGSYVFASNELKTIVFEEGPTMVGEYMFAGNYSIETIKFSSTVESIREAAFYHSAIESLTIPETLTIIVPGAFTGTSITALRIEGDETRFNSDWNTIGFPPNLKPQ